MKKIKWIALLCVAFATMFLNACGDSVDADEQSVAEVDESSSSVKSSSSSVKSSSSEALYPESFKPNDKDYPYADIPRIVVETEYRQTIKDRETEIPAKLQIWGEKEAESEIMDLTIRGRGNTSWNGMPKKSYKIEFKKKQSMLGMSKDKDWALIANYADKSLMRNYVTYKLSEKLDAYYVPKCEYAELYLNGEYLGVYLLTETIKKGEKRVNLSENEYSYIVEVDGKYRENEQIVFSDVLLNNGIGKAFRVHDPKNATDSSLNFLQEHICDFEKFLKSIDEKLDNKVDEWIDVDESIKHYWIQELSRNPDGAFGTSVYFSWENDGKIKMGPVWDFDLAYGNGFVEEYGITVSWPIRKYWYLYLFKDFLYKKSAEEYWKKNRDVFDSIFDLIDETAVMLKYAANNNFKRWNILGKTGGWLNMSFESYEEAVQSFKNWVSKRLQWIDANMQ